MKNKTETSKHEFEIRIAVTITTSEAIDPRVILRNVLELFEEKPQPKLTVPITEQIRSRVYASVGAQLEGVLLLKEHCHVGQPTISVLLSKLP